MNLVRPLDYATPAASLPLDRSAVTSLIVGIFSGPVGVGMAAVAVSNGNPEPAKEWSALASFLVCFLGSLLVGIWAYRRTSKAGDLRGRRLAVAGIVLTCSWQVLLFSFIVYALQQV